MRADSGVIEETPGFFVRLDCGVAELGTKTRLDGVLNNFLNFFIANVYGKCFFVYCLILRVYFSLSSSMTGNLASDISDEERLEPTIARSIAHSDRGASQSTFHIR